ncbi:conserved hypothetical protein [Parafrankia sp. EAN1pec]|uniref:hypothetical protein n=1 Tax=Parafrankia TaxID=2994362 RepID=UPI0000540FBA|nr:conserved hypothetical protein [Frankia sp. EAN1pec]
MSFYDKVESTFYGWCVERLLTTAEHGGCLAGGILEIGSGTAVPVVRALLRSGSDTRVHGFERDPRAAATARRAIGLTPLRNYVVDEGDFFTAVPTAAQRCVIGNPPYLPAEPGTSCAPDLWGGPRGAEVTQDVLDCGLDLAMLIVSSIADPLGVLRFARDRGYSVTDWMVTPIRFGRFCRDAGVRARIGDLAGREQAFFAPHSYLIAGVTFVRDAGARDQSAVLGDVLRAAGRASEVADPQPRAGGAVVGAPAGTERVVAGAQAGAAKRAGTAARAGTAQPVGR